MRFRPSIPQVGVADLAVPWGHDTKGTSENGGGKGAKG